MTRQQSYTSFKNIYSDGSAWIASAIVENFLIIKKRLAVCMKSTSPLTSWLLHTHPTASKWSGHYCSYLVLVFHQVTPWPSLDRWHISWIHLDQQSGTAAHWLRPLLGNPRCSLHQWDLALTNINQFEFSQQNTINTREWSGCFTNNLSVCKSKIVVTSSRMGWARLVACMEKKRYTYWVLVEIHDRNRTFAQT